jgi:hypothetical protein
LGLSGSWSVTTGDETMASKRAASLTKVGYVAASECGSTRASDVTDRGSPGGSSVFGVHVGFDEDVEYLADGALLGDGFA